jgi:hypothetical protein
MQENKGLCSFLGKALLLEKHSVKRAWVFDDRFFVKVKLRIKIL